MKNGTTKTMWVPMGYYCVAKNTKDHFIKRPICTPHMGLDTHSRAIPAS